MNLAEYRTTFNEVKIGDRVLCFTKKIWLRVKFIVKECGRVHLYDEKRNTIRYHAYWSPVKVKRWVPKRCGTCHYFKHPLFLACCWSSIPEQMGLPEGAGVYEETLPCEMYRVVNEYLIGKEEDRLAAIHGSGK